MRTTVKVFCWLLVGPALCGGGCSEKKHPSTPPDPLEEVTGFCEEWGKRACNDAVAKACLASDMAECAAQQALFCLNLLPPNYARKNADACLAKVAEAYADARLTAAEYEVVRNLGAPCDKLIEGPGAAGDSCTKDSDCNTLEDLKCVGKPGGPQTCQVPTIQGGGRSCVEASQICDKDFYCNGQNCIERRGAGQPCSAQEPCGEDATCAGPEGASVCTPKKANLEDCTDDGECLSKICSINGANGICAPEVVLVGADPLCRDLRQ